MWTLTSARVTLTFPRRRRADGRVKETTAVGQNAWEQLKDRCGTGKGQLPAWRLGISEDSQVMEPGPQKDHHHLRVAVRGQLTPGTRAQKEGWSGRRMDRWDLGQGGEGMRHWKPTWGGSGGPWSRPGGQPGGELEGGEARQEQSLGWRPGHTAGPLARAILGAQGPSFLTCGLSEVTGGSGEEESPGGEVGGHCRGWERLEHVQSPRNEQTLKP